MSTGQGPIFNLVNARTILMNSAAMDPEIEALIESNPELELNVRGPVEPGLSGATVLFVDYMNAGLRCQGVLKLTENAKALREKKGDSLARESWLNDLLPTSIIHLPAPMEGGRDGLLISLAGDRLDNCQKLKTALCNTFPFARNHVLPAIAGLYQREAAKHWGTARFRSMREIFCDPLSNCVNGDWEASMARNDLPNSKQACLIFEDNEERWPNPVAYFASSDTWPVDNGFGATVPWLPMHGDLNDGNVLCPTHERWMSISKTAIPRPEEMIKNLSLIDMPFFREMAFVYDAAFLVTWLKFLLPGFASHADRDSTLIGYTKAVEHICRERAPEDVPMLASRFVDCVWTLFDALRKGQPRMSEDIRNAFLCSLSAAALWQSLRLGSKTSLGASQREEAVSLICLSAIALRALLGEKQKRTSAGDDFLLRIKPGQCSHSKPWTNTTRRLGTIFAEHKIHRSIILVLGGEWAGALGLPTDSAVSKSLGESPPTSMDLNKTIEDSMRGPTSAIGRLPLAAVFDWSPLNEPRITVSSGIAAPYYVAPVFTGTSETNWIDHNSVPWIGLRGNVTLRDSIALTERDRSRKREKLRALIDQFRKNRSGDLVVIYAGVSVESLHEIHRMLDELWDNSAKYIHLCSPDIQSSISEFHETWNIEPLPGGIAEFLDACVDVSQTPVIEVSSGAPLDRLLLVSGMTRSSDGALLADSAKTLEVEIPNEDFVAIQRAGRLLGEAERDLMIRPPKDPRNFFIGHPIEFADLQAGVAIERHPIFQSYLDDVLKELASRHLSTITLRARPGAGASTALRWLAWTLAFQKNVPTLLLNKGGNCAFEAIERLYRLISCPFVVVADPQLVPNDELNGLRTRCAPSRLPVVFITSRRVLKSVAPIPSNIGDSPQPKGRIPLLEIELNDSERVAFLKQMVTHCPGVPWDRLTSSKTRSIFLLTLEAFGAEHVRLEGFVSGLLKNATTEQKLILATVALFSRYAHRSTSLDFLEIRTGRSWRKIEEDLSGFDQILVLHDGDDWTCRHDQISRALLQWCLTNSFHDQDYRHELSRFVCELIEHFQDDATGYEVASEYVWSLLNPLIESQANASGERSRQSRLINGEDGIPTNTGREKVFGTAAETFPDHVNIRAHCGKYFSEELQRWTDGENHISAALDLEPKNEATTHMMGKRFADEMRHQIQQHPVKTRAQSIDEHIRLLADSAQDWFTKTRHLNLSSEFGYTTALLVNRWLINDEYHRHGIKFVGENPEVLCAERVKELLADSARMISEGQRYIEPNDESRRVFNTEKGKLHALRGDLATAIHTFEQHVRTQQGYSRSLAKVHLARLYLESGEQLIRDGEMGRASKIFDKGATELSDVLQDPAMKFKNIKLWFDCARQVSYFKRADFIERLEQLSSHDAEDLDAVFLLMCLHFCEAVETCSPESWRLHMEYRRKSDRLSISLPIRRYYREWLVKIHYNIGGGRDEFRILPFHYFDGITGVRRSSATDNRCRLFGVIQKVDTSTQGYLMLDDLGTELFFKPRAGEHHFYASDAATRRRVSFKVAFNYEKPEAIDVQPE